MTTTDTLTLDTIVKGLIEKIEADALAEILRTVDVCNLFDCSPPTARNALRAVASETAWLKRSGQHWRIRGAEERERILRKRGDYQRAKACVAELRACDVDAKHDEGGRVAVPVDFLRALMGASD